jgi:hypothetical protein
LKEIQNAKDKMEELKLRQKEKRKEELVVIVVNTSSLHLLEFPFVYPG